MTPPKTKGCFQCSRRRIICDLGQPHCRKCKQKGLECSGLGRIRFVPGVASRGKFKNSRIPAIQQVSEEQQIPAPAPCSTVAGRREILLAVRPSHSDTGEKDPESPLAQEVDLLFSSPIAEQSQGDETASIAILQKAAQQLSQAVYPTPQAWLPPIGHHARMLLSHFSNAVAPVMVVIDGLKNGYREFILPLACQDNLLQRAVGVVAAQHLSQSQPQLKSAAEKGQKAIIDRLQRDALSGTSVFTTTTWIALIVLLVGETINPSSSFAPLLRMLLLTAQNCNEDTIPRELHDFLTQQTHMFEIIARPQLSEQEGVEIISQSLFNRLDWIPHDFPPGSEHNLAVEISHKTFVEAFQIYLGRAKGDSTNTHASVKKLRSLVSQLSPSAHGAHALVWPCFVAAIESVDPDDRAFFLQRLAQIHSRTRFGNVQAAIDSIPRICDLNETSSWTSSLADALPVLIM
ncbi:hypothetical protein PFICI_12037 [Pestalotiopsis fici W106-1]|uniref:Zn(2)-C6 fungal-type domain-containing protein n=1 Tax=Pestalotiopsis fici (strain W106-1 / CGMCC3.15140) TaxID=1229662 RepID=W3WS18_PESFW|nr:uncharacterized protein PFICI_12037 [Pestalotiopsis fici W106-1]ETS76650.1 hypothetical protein PFICI_12037 [Pestalotiopsis fici W106-1]